MSNEATVNQTDPIENDKEPIYKQVVIDLETRAHVGKAKYGTHLQAFNGRDALVDAYQEALDLTQYIKQELVEREDLRARIVELEYEKYEMAIAALENLQDRWVADIKYNAHARGLLDCASDAAQELRALRDKIRAMLQGVPE